MPFLCLLSFRLYLPPLLNCPINLLIQRKKPYTLKPLFTPSLPYDKAVQGVLCIAEVLLSPLALV